MAKSKSKDYPYEFKPEKMNKVCEFIEGLPHTKGHWAAKQELIRLEPFQCFIYSVFGWIRREDGYRRFRWIYIEMPRKNGKSLISGAMGLYMLCADGEFGAEVYSGATTEQQAWEVFKPAKLMVERTLDLQEAFGVSAAAKQINIIKNGSLFKPLIGSPGDGQSPHCAIVDEYHEHATNAFVDTMDTGMGARLQPLIWIITTAGSNTAGPCYELRQDVIKILQGTMERDDLFGLIYTIDAHDDWTSEDAMKKANPNFGISVQESFMRSQQIKAIQSARLQNEFKTKHLNIWIGAKNAWMNMQSWAALKDESLRREEFQGCPAFAAVDLSSKLDLTARVIVFKKVLAGKDHFYCFPDFWIPEKQTLLPEKQHYASWLNRGCLNATPGNVIDYETVENSSVESIQRFRIQRFGFDPFNAERSAQEIASRVRGSIVVEVPNQVRVLSDPMKSLEALVEDRRIHHDGNPVMTWCMSNVVAAMDKKGNVFPNKERNDSKIDGVIALIMALFLALAGGSKPSIYETRGLVSA